MKEEKKLRTKESVSELETTKQNDGNIKKKTEQETQKYGIELTWNDQKAYNQYKFDR